MALLKDQVVEKIQDLRDPELREVLRFVDFLMWRAGQDDDSLLSVAGILSGESLSAAQIENELYGESKRT